MAHDDDTPKEIVGSEDEIEKEEEWMNEHGQPDFEFLQSLAATGGPEALEQLQSIADDLDVMYGPEATPDELVEKIRLATEQNEDGNPATTA